jgi:hyaluronoglucosaminidase
VTAETASAGYGLVEGFYGTPWKLEQKIRIIHDLGDSGLTTYLWAPKDEPSHRKAWQGDLSSEARREIEALARAARDASVDFVYGISPLGIARRARGVSSEHRLDPAALAALVRRVDVARAEGASRFALLFDDTWPTLFSGAASTSLGRAHGEATLTVLSRLDRVERAGVLLVPAVYHRRAGELAPGALSYLRGIASQVGRDVPVAWTGPRVFSSWIAGSDIEALERATGLRLFIWNNAIANDWLPLVTSALGKRRRVERLSTGPITNLGEDALVAASGVLLNGAREAELTRVAARSFGELVRAPMAFDPSASWARAIDDLFGGASTPVRQLLDRVRGHPLCAAHACDWTLSDLARAARAGDRQATERLLAWAEDLAGLEERLSTSLAGHPALPELQPTAAAIREAAESLRAAIAGRRDGPRSARRAWMTDLDDTLGLFRKRRFG